LSSAASFGSSSSLIALIQKFAFGLRHLGHVAPGLDHLGDVAALIIGFEECARRLGDGLEFGIFLGELHIGRAAALAHFRLKSGEALKDSVELGGRHDAHAALLADRLPVRQVWRCKPGNGVPSGDAVHLNPSVRAT
jgi:hypothetical protein